jgi:hypothetical protein
LLPNGPTAAGRLVNVGSFTNVGSFANVGGLIRANLSEPFTSVEAALAAFSSSASDHPGEKEQREKRSESMPHLQDLHSKKFPSTIRGG